MQLQSLPWLTLTQAAFGTHGLRTSHGWRHTPSRQNSAKEQSSLRVHWTVHFFLLDCTFFGAILVKKKTKHFHMQSVLFTKKNIVYGTLCRMWIFVCHFEWRKKNICQQLYALLMIPVVKTKSSKCLQWKFKKKLESITSAKFTKNNIKSNFV